MNKGRITVLEQLQLGSDDIVEILWTETIVGRLAFHSHPSKTTEKPFCGVRVQVSGFCSPNSAKFTVVKPQRGDYGISNKTGNCENLYWFYVVKSYFLKFERFDRWLTMWKICVNQFSTDFFKGTLAVFCKGR